VTVGDGQSIFDTGNRHQQNGDSEPETAIGDGSDGSDGSIPLPSGDGEVELVELPDGSFVEVRGEGGQI
jgi:hypothetical protein